MKNGIVILDKPAGFTSFDVVAKAKGIFHTKSIGHGGTLDPNATGVLVLFIGKATKLCEMLSAERKTYESTLLLGEATDTEDIWGTVTKKENVTVSEEKVREAILSFIGSYRQTPPMVSAKKKDGARLYDLARKGIFVPRESVPVTIYDISILSMDLPKVDFRVTCSKGTYIRTLCSDIGKRLGLPACMASLRRIRQGAFSLSDAVTLPALAAAVREGREDDVVISAESLFSSLPSRILSAEAERFLRNGNVLYAHNFLPAKQVNPARENETKIRVYLSDGTFAAVYERADAEASDKANAEDSNQAKAEDCNQAKAEDYNQAKAEECNQVKAEKETEADSDTQYRFRYLFL